MGKDFTCPYCNNKTTLSEPFYDIDEHELDIAKPEGFLEEIFVDIEAITCPNPACKKLVFNITIRTEQPLYSNIGGRTIPMGRKEKVINTWQLLPPADIKVFPKYIPKPILKDYEEACLIKNLSPKASATISRRCLQGIIRDFWNIKDKTLKKEIDQLETKIDKNLWDAIDDIRKIGNIGAHMEKDINVIIDVEPDEAQTLIDLIEILLEEWYIKRHQRTEKIKKLKSIVKKKEKLKNKNTSKTGTSNKKTNTNAKGK